MPSHRYLQSVARPGRTSRSRRSRGAPRRPRRPSLPRRRTARRRRWSRGPRGRPGNLSLSLSLCPSLSLSLYIYIYIYIDRFIYIVSLRLSIIKALYGLSVVSMSVHDTGCHAINMYMLYVIHVIGLYIILSVNVLSYLLVICYLSGSLHISLYHLVVEPSRVSGLQVSSLLPSISLSSKLIYLAFAISFSQIALHAFNLTPNNYLP